MIETKPFLHTPYTFNKRHPRFSDPHNPPRADVGLSVLLHNRRDLVPPLSSRRRRRGNGNERSKPIINPTLRRVQRAMRRIDTDTCLGAAKKRCLQWIREGKGAERAEDWGVVGDDHVDFFLESFL